ncbi:TPA: hypothetical protein ACMDN8_004531, partial [Vibrio parahaemolyticus]
MASSRKKSFLFITHKNLPRAAVPIEEAVEIYPTPPNKPLSKQQVKNWQHKTKTGETSSCATKKTIEKRYFCTRFSMIFSFKPSIF